MASKTKAKAKDRSSGSTHRSSLSSQKTEVLINVYDLLPPGRLSSTLWVFGSSLLHSGVVIRDREYAYGGHDHRGLSGVYWTPPRTEPPGGTFRAEILHGFTVRSEDEINAIVQEVSDEFLGPSYNLLHKNCNHFTSALCRRLTSKAAPNWLNRAANIGIALPCVVPREWVAPPDHETADGRLLDDEEAHEQSVMLRRREPVQHQRDVTEEATRTHSWDGDASHTLLRHTQSSHAEDDIQPATLRDTSGRTIPLSQRAPSPHD